MSLAYSSLIIFLIILPGYLWRKGYLFSPLSKKTSRSFVDELSYSIIPALILHLIGWFFVKKLTPYNFDIKLFLNVFKIESTLNSEVLISNISKFSKEIIIYNVGVISSGFICGVISRRFVRLLKLDIKYSLFRFSNNWYYILRGESINFHLLKENFYTHFIYPLYIWIDVLVCINNQEILYKGILIDYYLDKEGNLDRIHLRGAKKRNLNEEGKPFRKVQGNKMIIPSDHIVNMNISYVVADLEDKNKKSEKVMTNLKKSIESIINSHWSFRLLFFIKKDIWKNHIKRNKLNHLNLIWLKNRFLNYLSKIFKVPLLSDIDIIEIHNSIKRIKNQSLEISELIFLFLIIVVYIFFSLKFVLNLIVGSLLVWIIISLVIFLLFFRLKYAVCRSFGFRFNQWVKGGLN